MEEIAPFIPLYESLCELSGLPYTQKGYLQPIPFYEIFFFLLAFKPVNPYLINTRQFARHW